MKKWFVFLVVLAYSSIILAQKPPEKANSIEPIQKTLKYIQDYFKITVSYKTKIIAGKKIFKRSKYKNLQEAISDIEEQSGLIFTEITKGNYVLKSKNNSDQRISICVSLKDINSNLPITDAFILIAEDQIQVKSNNEGYYEFKDISKNTTLSINSPGREGQNIRTNELSETKCNIIYLEEAHVNSLDEIIIKDYFANGFSKTGNGSIKILPKKIHILPGISRMDILESLQLIPGIQSPDETITGLNVRGGTPDQNLVLWDGIKLYQDNHFFGMLSAINSVMVNSIHLYRNGASAKYSNHISSVIDIKSDSRIPDKVLGGAGINMIYGDMFVKAPISNNVGVFFSARRSYSDIAETVTFDKFSEHIFQNTRTNENNLNFNDFLSKTNHTFYFTDFMMKLLVNLNKKSHLSFSSLYFRNNLKFLSNFDQINQFTNDNLNIENKGANLNWRHEWNKSFKTDVNISYSDYKFNFKGKETLFNFFDKEITKKNNISDFQVDVQSIYQWKKSKMINGASITYNDLHYTIGSRSDVIFDEDFLIESENRTNVTYSMYNENIFLVEQVRFQCGLRTDYFNKLSKIYLQPRVSISSLFKSQFNFNLEAEIQYQPISQIIEFETKEFGLGNRIWVIADSDEIPMLKSNQISFGVTYKKDNWFVDFENYYKEIKNITSITNGFSQETENITIGESRILGMDTMLKKKWNEYFTSFIGYSLTNNTFRFPNLNNDKPFKGNFDIRHHLNLIQFFNYKDFEVAVGWKYRTSKPYTPAIGLSGTNGPDIAIDYEEINSQYLDNYHRLDISVNYTINNFLNKDMSLSIGGALLNVYNYSSIMDRNYRIILNRENATFNLRQTDKYSMGRIPNISIRLNFM